MVFWRCVQVSVKAPAVFRDTASRAAYPRLLFQTKIQNIHKKQVLPTATPQFHDNSHGCVDPGGLHSIHNNAHCNAFWVLESSFTCLRGLVRQCKHDQLLPTAEVIRPKILYQHIFVVRRKIEEKRINFFTIFGLFLS